MNELLIQSGAFGLIAAVALGLIRLLEKTWDKRNGKNNSNSLGLIITKQVAIFAKIESSLDAMTQFHRELIRDLREIREDQKRIKSCLTKLGSDSDYLRSWHEKTESGRIAAYYPHDEAGQQHRDTMEVLRAISTAVKGI